MVSLGAAIDANGSEVLTLLLPLPFIKSPNGSLICAPVVPLEDEDEDELLPTLLPIIPRLKFGAALFFPDIILLELWRKPSKFGNVDEGAGTDDVVPPPESKLRLLLEPPHI